jgi:hypothetical protein
VKLLKKKRQEKRSKNQEPRIKKLEHRLEIFFEVFGFVCEVVKKKRQDF